MSTDRTIAKRQAEHTAKLLADGGRRITVRLPPETNAALTAHLGETGESANALILRLLQNYLSKR